MLYQLVFAMSDILGCFGIYTSHPHSLVELDCEVSYLEGTLIVEEDEGLVDPLLSLGHEVCL